MSGFRYRPEFLQLQGMPDQETTYLKQYEHWFILEPEQLRRITDHFVKELEQGLSKEGGNIVSRLLHKHHKDSGINSRIRDGIAHESHLGDGIPLR